MEKFVPVIPDYGRTSCQRLAIPNYVSQEHEKETEA